MDPEHAAPMSSSPWMTPQEAADYLHIALGTLRNWTSARFVPFVKRGRIVRYHRDAIDRWLSKGGYRRAIWAHIGEQSGPTWFMGSLAEGSR